MRKLHKNRRNSATLRKRPLGECGAEAFTMLSQKTALVLSTVSACLTTYTTALSSIPIKSRQSRLGGLQKCYVAVIHFGTFGSPHNALFKKCRSRPCVFTLAVFSSAMQFLSSRFMSSCPRLRKIIRCGTELPRQTKTLARTRRFVGSLPAAQFDVARWLVAWAKPAGAFGAPVMIDTNASGT